jgi:hypothetical protein
MAAYSFVTQWRFQAPIERVWDALNTPERYAEWWPCILEYRKLNPEITGVGAQAERVVKGRLPYSLRYRTTITRHEEPHEIAYDAEGQLLGRGRFVLCQEGGWTHVIFYWDVRTTGFWMNALAPLLKRLFAWNHNWVMAQGEKGLAEWLENHRRAG